LKYTKNENCVKNTQIIWDFDLAVRKKLGDDSPNPDRGPPFGDHCT
jgi:hypothetical protein